MDKSKQSSRPEGESPLSASWLEEDEKKVTAWQEESLSSKKQSHGFFSYFMFTRQEWYKQLMDASRFGGRGVTFLSTFFINLVSLVFPMMLMQIYDRIIPMHSFETLTVLSIVVCAALMLELILRIARSYVNLWGDTKFENALSRIAFSKLVDAPLSAYEQSGTGARLKQLATLDQMRGFYNNQLLSSLVDIPFVAIFLAVIAYIGGWLFLVALLVLLVLTVVSFHLLEKWEPTLHQKLAHESHENNFVVDVLNNIHTVKSMAMESLLIRRYERLQLSGSNVSYHSSVEAGDMMALKMLSSQIITILIVIAGSVYVIKGYMAVGGLAACSLLAGRIMQPMSRALGAFHRWKTVNVVRRQLDAVLALPVEDKSMFPVFGEFKGEMQLEHVSFRYDEKSKWILKDLNLTVPARTIIGIIGGEQSGKTTLVNIMATLFAPTEGTYFIDGKDVSQYQLSDLRKQIAYLSHLGELFRGTIMENLSAFNEEQVNTARQLSHALGLDMVIAKLPNGFDTIVGDRAVEALPRGVVNRMVVVRALASKPKIILFDEANMNFDVTSNNNLFNLLTLLKEIATIVLVSQNKEALKIAEVVYELKDGQLTKLEQGLS